MYSTGMVLSGGIEVRGEVKVPNEVNASCVQFSEDEGNATTVQTTD